MRTSVFTKQNINTKNTYFNGMLGFVCADLCVDTLEDKHVGLYAPAYALTLGEQDPNLRRLRI